MENEINNQNKKAGASKMIIGLVLIIIIALVWWWMKRDTLPVAPNTVNNDNTSVPVTNSRKYKNGTYTAIGNYISPAGTEQVDISITLVDDKITAATFTGEAVNPTSKRMQTNFKAGFSSLVVGKNIDEVSLTAVNGSSLAPKGFMDALSKVKIEAKNS